MKIEIDIQWLEFKQDDKEYCFYNAFLYDVTNRFSPPIQVGDCFQDGRKMQNIQSSDWNGLMELIKCCISEASKSYPELHTETKTK